MTSIFSLKFNSDVIYEIRTKNAFYINTNDTTLHINKTKHDIFC